MTILGFGTPPLAFGNEESSRLMLLGDDAHGVELSEKSSGVKIDEELTSPRPLP